MSEQLTPCPFCGGEMRDRCIERFPSRQVMCNDCGARGPRAKGDEAIEQWNRRSHPTCATCGHRKELAIQGKGHCRPQGGFLREKNHYCAAHTDLEKGDG